MRTASHGQALQQFWTPEERHESARKAEARWAEAKEQIRQLERDVRALERCATGGRRGSG